MLDNKLIESALWLTGKTMEEMTEEEILSYLECKYWSEGNEVNELLIMTEYNFNRICEK